MDQLQNKWEARRIEHPL